MATADDRVVEARRVVSAAPDIVFTVVTTPADMTGWLSNEVRCEARPGGVYELRWNSGYAVRGEVKAVTKPTSFSVAWQGSSEPGATTVTFTLLPVTGGTDVTVRQSGFGRSKKWEEVMAESRRGWERSLENLQHLVETGIDLARGAAGGRCWASSRATLQTPIVAPGKESTRRRASIWQASLMALAPRRQGCAPVT